MSRVAPRAPVRPRRAIAAAGTPLVCVLYHGGAIALGEVLKSCDAVLDAFFPGQQGGAALADVLFGRRSPAGRLPHSIYEDADLPAFGASAAVTRGLTYRYTTKRPLLPFGFGMSYTAFTYSAPEASPTTAAACEDVVVRVNVTNVGNVTSDEVAQLYARGPAGDDDAPRVRLADFARLRDVRPRRRRTFQTTAIASRRRYFPPRRSLRASRAPSH